MWSKLTAYGFYVLGIFNIAIGALTSNHQLWLDGVIVFGLGIVVENQDTIKALKKTIEEVNGETDKQNKD